MLSTDAPRSPTLGRASRPMSSLRAMPRQRELDLSQIWLFSACSAGQLRTIRKSIEEVEVPADRVLVRGRHARTRVLLHRRRQCLRAAQQPQSGHLAARQVLRRALAPRSQAPLRHHRVRDAHDVAGPRAAPVQRPARRHARRCRTSCSWPWRSGCATPTPRPSTDARVGPVDGGADTREERSVPGRRQVLLHPAGARPSR